MYIKNYTQYCLCIYTLITVFSFYEKGINKMFAPPNPEKFLIQFFTTNTKEKDVKIS